MKAITAIAPNQVFPTDFIPELVIFHNVVQGFACPDGLASAWVCHQKFVIEMGYEVRFIGCTYEENPPDLTQYENILVVDFSFPVQVLELWEVEGKRVITIDHHLGFKQRIDQAKVFSLSPSILDSLYLDMTECGATLCFKLLFPGQELPVFLQYIKDRDLFEKQLPYTDEVHAGMGRLRRSFGLFDQLAVFNQFMLIDFLKPYGEITLQKKYAVITKYMKKVEFWGSDKINICIPVVTLTQSDTQLKSDLGEFLCKNYPFAPFCVILISYKKQWQPYVRIKSCAVTQDTDCVTLFADRNPGGHRNAANFSWNGSREELEAFIVGKAESLK